MADIFVSYSSEERELTTSLVSDLEFQGYDVWWDTILLSGEVFEAEITKQLDAASAAIIIWTPKSIASMWVRAEAERSLEQNKIIPVRSKDLAHKDIPLPFRDLHTDFIDDRQKIYKVLERKNIAKSHERYNDPVFGKVMQDYATDAKGHDQTMQQSSIVRDAKTPTELRMILNRLSTGLAKDFGKARIQAWDLTAFAEINNAFEARDAPTFKRAVTFYVDHFPEGQFIDDVVELVEALMKK